MDGSVFNQTEHAMMAARDHDNAARQKAVRSCRQSLLGRLSMGSRDMYYRELAPSYEAEKGHAPKDWREIHDLMTSQNYVRFQLGFHRVVQELMWHTLVDSVEGQAKELAARAVSLNRGLGSLDLDPSFEPPRYLTAVDIHCQPGGYCIENFPGDVAAGAIYDRAINMYQSGRGGLTDYAGKTIIAYVERHFPQFKPKKILDLGCTIGHSTVPWKEAFPDAEVHGVDLAAPILRYAHARSQAMGVTVHYHQDDAVNADFPDGEFDLIFSSMLLHEIPGQLRTKLFQNIRRMLKPGGLMWHYELPPDSLKSPYENFYLNWDSYYNVEPYYKSLRGGDYKELSVSAGFAPESFLQTTVPSRNLYGDDAIRKAAAESGPSEALGAVGQLISGVRWFGFGAWKEGDIKSAGSAA